MTNIPAVKPVLRVTADDLAQINNYLMGLIRRAEMDCRARDLAEAEDIKLILRTSEVEGGCHLEDRAQQVADAQIKTIDYLFGKVLG